MVELLYSNSSTDTHRYSNSKVTQAFYKYFLTIYFEFNTEIYKIYDSSIHVCV